VTALKIIDASSDQREREKAANVFREFSQKRKKNWP
jgi:hypothetical protein